MVSGHVLSQLYREQLFEVLAKKKKKKLNNPCRLVGVSLVLGEKWYELLKAREEQVSVLGPVLGTPHPSAPFAQLHFQLPPAMPQHSPGKTLPVVSPPCPSHVSLRHPAWDTACVSGARCPQLTPRPPRQSSPLAAATPGSWYL